MLVCLPMTNRLSISLLFFVLAAVAQMGTGQGAKEADPVRVLVWDERQAEQKQAYGERFLGQAIADALEKQGFLVRSTGLDEAAQGLHPALLDWAEVLIWWGHVRHSKITPEIGKKIVKRIKQGRLSLIALHSAHWATPFVEAMNAKSRQEATARFAGRDWTLEEVPLRARYYLPKQDEPPTPRTEIAEADDGKVRIKLYLPNCCFPAYADRGTPSDFKVLAPEHPITKGLPPRFEIPKTEMYADPFQVPDPDAVLFEERWKEGETFRSGLVWNLGAGKVFYFRPGHETYPIFLQEIPLKILGSAARWMGETQRSGTP